MFEPRTFRQKRIGFVYGWQFVCPDCDEKFDKTYNGQWICVGCINNRTEFEEPEYK